MYWQSRLDLWGLSSGISIAAGLVQPNVGGPLVAAVSVVPVPSQTGGWKGSTEFEPEPFGKVTVWMSNPLSTQVTLSRP
jgi:hypothetical protein